MRAYVRDSAEIIVHHWDAGKARWLINLTSRGLKNVSAVVQSVLMVSFYLFAQSGEIFNSYVM